MFPVIMRSLAAVLAFTFLVSGLAHAQGTPRARLLDAPRPVKSAETSRLRLSGTVFFVLHMDQRSGKVASVKIARSTGHPVLDASAVAGLKKWRCEPGTVRMIHTPLTFTAGQNVAQF